MSTEVRCDRCGLVPCACEILGEVPQSRVVKLGGATFRVRHFRGTEVLSQHGLVPALAAAMEFRSMQSAYRAWSDHVAVLGAGCFQLAQIGELVRGGAPEEAVFPYALELYLRACWETAFAVSQDGTDSEVDCFVFEELEKLGVDGARLWEAAEKGRIRTAPDRDAKLLVVKARAVPLDRWEAFRAWEARHSS